MVNAKGKTDKSKAKLTTEQANRLRAAGKAGGQATVMQARDNGEVASLYVPPFGQEHWQYHGSAVATGRQRLEMAAWLNWASCPTALHAVLGAAKHPRGA
jgi:hypothetical protein